MTKSIAFIFFVALFLSGGVVQAVSPVDSDSDGLSDDIETLVYHTDINNSDTDGDGFSDGKEVDTGYSPRFPNMKKMAEVDSDKDGLSDELEIELHTDLLDTDTDDDTFLDGAEVKNGFHPLKGNRDRSLPRRVEVDLSTQQLAYFLGEVKIASAPVSSGKLATPTPTGEFEIIRKLPVHHYVGPGYNLPNTKWNLEFKRSFYLHGAYWHNQFGIRPMSHGCVNIAYKDVEKMYAFLDVGDKVIITGKTPIKPLPKPSQLAAY
jgi:hypothetical protein